MFGDVRRTGPPDHALSDFARESELDADRAAQPDEERVAPDSPPGKRTRVALFRGDPPASLAPGKRALSTLVQRAQQTTGQPLDAELRRRLEESLRVDLGRV